MTDEAYPLLDSDIEEMIDYADAEDAAACIRSICERIKERGTVRYKDPSAPKKSRRKWTYWHIVEEVLDPIAYTSKKGTIVGLDYIHREWQSWSKERGFFVSARFKYLGKLPFDLHETDPKEAGRRIKEGEWST